MPITVTMLQTRQGEGGSLWTVGNSYSASDAFGSYLITSNLATGSMPAVPVTGISPAVATAITALVSKDGITGVWRQVPAAGPVMRVRMTGTGNVTMDSATGDLGAGTVTTAVYTASVAGTQIDDFAYPGDAARSIRITLTGTAAVEVY